MDQKRNDMEYFVEFVTSTKKNAESSLGSKIRPVNVKSNYGSHSCKSSHHFAIPLEQKEADYRDSHMEPQKFGLHLQAI